MFDSCPMAKGVSLARVFEAASLTGFREFLRLLLLLNWLWFYLTPPVFTTHKASVKYLNYMESTVLDAMHAATSSTEYFVYVLSVHSLITSAAGITEGNFRDTPPTLKTNTFKYTNKMWHSRNCLEEFLELTKNYHPGFCNSGIPNCKCSFIA